MKDLSENTDMGDNLSLTYQNDILSLTVQSNH